MRGSVSTTLGGLPRRCVGSRNALHRNERRHPHLHAGARRDGRQRARGQPHRLGQLGAGRLGPAVVAQPVGQPPRRRRGSSPDRRCGGRPYLRCLKVLVDRHRPPYKAAGAVFLVIAAVVGAFIYLQFRGDLTRQDPADPAVAAGGPGGRTGLEGDLQRCGDRPGRRHRHGRRATARAMAKLTLDVNPATSQYIPANVVAEIRATTVFGNKYISFSSPKDPSPQRISSHDVIDASAVTTEFNTLFETVTSIAEQVDPDQAEPDADRDRRGADRAGRPVRRFAGATATRSSTT